MFLMVAREVELPSISRNPNVWQCMSECVSMCELFKLHKSPKQDLCLHASSIERAKDWCRFEVVLRGRVGEGAA